MIDQRIQVLLNEALGVPSQIEMLTDIFTDMVFQEVEALRISDEYEEADVEIKNYGGTVAKKYETTVKATQSWSFVKNHPSFNMEEWKKFPMYRNEVTITVDVLDDEAANHVVDDLNMPLVNGSHNFTPDKFEVKNLKTLGDVFDIGKFEFKIITGESDFKGTQQLKTKISATIAHEIFHDFQLYIKYIKSNEKGFGKAQVLNTMAGHLKTGFSKEFNYFLHVLYLSLQFEHQARIPQALRIIKSKTPKTNQEFIDALKQTDAWQDIQRLRNFSAEKIIKSYGEIKGFEDIFRLPQSLEYSKETITDWNIWIDRVKDFMVKNGLTVNPFRGLSQKLLNDPVLFFEHWERVFKKRANEYYVKLAKLYGLI